MCFNPFGCFQSVILSASVNIYVVFVWTYMLCLCEHICCVCMNIYVVFVWTYMLCLYEHICCVCVNIYVVFVWTYMLCLYEHICCVCVNIYVVFVWTYMLCLYEHICCVCMKLWKESEEEQQKALNRALNSSQRENERLMRQTEERMREDSADEVKKLVQKHKMEISIAKKKQWVSLLEFYIEVSTFHKQTSSDSGRTRICQCCYLQCIRSCVATLCDGKISLLAIKHDMA